MLIPRVLDIGPGQVRQDLLLIVLTTIKVGLKILQKGVAKERNPKVTLRSRLAPSRRYISTEIDFFFSALDYAPCYPHPLPKKSSWWNYFCNDNRWCLVVQDLLIRVVFKHKCNQLLVCSILLLSRIFLSSGCSSARMTARTGQANQSFLDLGTRLHCISGKYVVLSLLILTYWSPGYWAISLA